MPIVRKSAGLKILESLRTCLNQYRDCFTHFLPSLLFLHPAVILTPASVSVFLTSSLETSDSSTYSCVAPCAHWLPVQRIPFPASFLAPFSLYIPNFHHTLLLIVSLHVLLRTATSSWLLQRTIIQWEWSVLFHTALRTLSINSHTHSACIQTPQSYFFLIPEYHLSQGSKDFPNFEVPQGWYKTGCTLENHKYEEPPYTIWSPVFVHLQTYVGLSAFSFRSVYPDVLTPSPPLC